MAKAKARAKAKAKTRGRKRKTAVAADLGGPSRVSVVPTGSKVCKPFLLEVMVFSPEAGFKFKVVV